jgi:hypothetical protein
MGVGKTKIVAQPNKALDLFYDLKRLLFGKKNISSTRWITVFIRTVKLNSQRLFVAHQMSLLPEMPTG